MRKRTRLGIVDVPLAGASVFVLKSLPALRGLEEADLVCGQCGVVLVEGVSPLNAKAHFGAPAQIVITCPRCRAHNVLPSTTMTPPVDIVKP